MTSRLPLCLAVFLILSAPVQATSLCTDVARLVRQGAAENTNKYGERSVIARVAANSGGLLRVEEDRSARLPQRFPAEGLEGPDVRMTPLGKSGVVAVTRSAGSMHCQSWSFFRDDGKRATRLPDPAVAAHDDDNTGLCGDSYGEVVDMGGVPVFVTENDAWRNRAALTLTPWQGKRWGAMCSISASFAPSFRLDGDFCKHGQSKCEALRTRAMELVRLYRTDPRRLPGAAGRNTPTSLDMDDLPLFKISTSNPYTHFEQKRVMPVMVAGEKLLAVLGNGSFGWRDYSGTLAAFWRDTGETLEPVAGYQVGTYRGPAKTVTVGPR